MDPQRHLMRSSNQTDLGIRLATSQLLRHRLSMFQLQFWIGRTNSIHNKKRSALVQVKRMPIAQHSSQQIVGTLVFFPSMNFARQLPVVA